MARGMLATAILQLKDTKSLAFCFASVVSDKHADMKESKLQK